MEKRKYRAIALDVDGTILNSKKELTPKVRQAIRRALEEGIQVALCTGRSLAEAGEFMEAFPDMQYLSLESGSMLYDVKAGKPVRVSGIPEEVAREIYQTIQGKDIMVQLFSEGKSMVRREHVEQLEKYYMGQYRRIYEQITTYSEDPIAEVLADHASIEKINLYHTTVEARLETLKELQEKKLGASLIFSEITSLECTAPGIDKGNGILQLADVLGVSTDEIIMVGDAYNDIPAMKKAGLGIAMGNANEEVKAIAGAIVGDCDHDGCAEAFEQFLF